MAIISRIIFLCMCLTGCTSLIYQPDHYLYAHPNQFKVKFETREFPSIDGTKLTAWKLLSQEKNPRNLIVLFHGNAQNMTSHFVNLVWLTKYDYDAMVFDYRGYGVSEGQPYPKGVAEDGLAFLNYAYAEYKKGGYKKLIVYAQSLGGAIVLKSLEDFSHRDEIGLLVLDSTFLSPREVAKEKTNRLFALAISNDFTADPKLTHITMPVLSIHSKQDFVIAYQLGQDLYNKLNSSPKKTFWTTDVKGHGNVFFIEELRYREQFLQFIKNLY